MIYIGKHLFFLLICILTVTGTASVHAQSDVPLINKDELKAMLTDPDLVILDVRRGKDWTSSEFKIQGAIYADPGEYQNWIANYPKDKKLVLYCA